MPFINCDQTGNSLSSILNLLENNSNLLLTGVDSVVDTLDGFVTDKVMGSTQDIENSIKAVGDGIFDILPDYTNRLNNVGGALSRYDQDLAEFKKLLDNCPQVKLRSYFNSLNLNIKLPKLPDLDRALFQYSAIRQGLRDLSQFPLTYLTEIKQAILDNALNGINGLAGGLKEFITASGLDDLEALIPSKILALAQHAEYLINCAQGIACSDLVKQIDRYDGIMSPLPLSPAFELITGKKITTLPKFVLDTSGILSTSKAGAGQITNLKNAKTSVTGAMDYARTLTSKF